MNEIKLFGKNLKMLRLERNISQAALGLQFNKRSTAVSSWELGLSAPNLQDMIKIANFFGVDVGDLVGKDLAQGKFSEDSNSDINGKIVGKVPGKVYNNLNNNVSNIKEKESLIDNWPFVPNTYALNPVTVGQLPEFMNNQERLKDVPMIYVPGVGAGLHFRLPVTFDNMSPFINQGDFIIITYQPDITNALVGGNLIYYIDNEGETGCNNSFYSQEILSQFDEEHIASMRIFNVPTPDKAFILHSTNRFFTAKIKGIHDFKWAFLVTEGHIKFETRPVNQMNVGMQVLMLETKRKMAEERNITINKTEV